MASILPKQLLDYCVREPITFPEKAAFSITFSAVLLTAAKVTFSPPVIAYSWSILTTAAACYLIINVAIRLFNINKEIPLPETLDEKESRPCPEEENILESVPTLENEPLDYVSGKEHYDNGEYESAFHLLKPLADSTPPNLRASLLVAEMHFGGKGVEQDYPAALNYFQSVANLGDAEAHRRVGNLFYWDKYGLKNHGKAFKNFLFAANQGNAAAQTMVGHLYHMGEGVEIDHEKSFDWTKQAAEQNCKVAQFNLGKKYLLGKGTEKDLKKALCYAQYAKQGGYELSSATKLVADIEKAIAEQKPKSKIG